MTQHTCPSCRETFPVAASFCPFCGVTAPAPAIPFNRAVVVQFANAPDPSDSPALDAEMANDSQPGRGHGLKLLVAGATFGAVTAGIAVGSWLSYAAS